MQSGQRIIERQVPLGGRHAGHGSGVVWGFEVEEEA
jgi:hypothetical protein